jgi:hypothetical protein
VAGDAASRRPVAADDVPDALDVAIARTDLGLAEQRLWWRVVGGCSGRRRLVALAGLVWLAVRFAMFAAGLPDLPTPNGGILLLPTALLFGGLLFGVLLSIVVRPFVGSGPTGAAQRRRKAPQRRRRTSRWR